MAEFLQERRATKAKPLLFLSLLFTVVSLSGLTVSAVEQLPVAKIISVEAPSRISPNDNFTVVVAVDYSASYSTDIAILDAATSFVLASKGLIIPAGCNSLTFQLTGLDQPGPWELMATVRVWWNEGWYANQNGSTFPFEVTITDASNASLAITSNTVATIITIDGIPHEVPSNGIELSTTRGLHTVEAESSFGTADGVRVVFDHWSDGLRSLHREIYLEGKLGLSAIYLTEYLLTVESDFGVPVGSGWYPAGTNATFGVADSVSIQHTSDGPVTHKFDGWSGDSHSSFSVDQVIMDGPKTVLANWAKVSPQTIQPFLLEVFSSIFLASSMILAALGVVMRKRDWRKATNSHSKEHVVRRYTLVLGLFAILALTTIQPVHASTIIQPSIVSIGDATWYHWNQAASDTLLIWLGGGIVEPATLLVNPYEFESYNTMYFLQDLSRHYDVLALEKGSMRYVDSALNRTVFRGPYIGSNDFIKEIRSWAYAYRYTYLYVVGYSVGAMAAATELILAHPYDWTSPDGLIVITTNISSTISYQAGSLRASLLLLYGDKIEPEFTASGQAIFQNAPEEGWRNGFWFHKEFHVVSDVEHEVWTIRDTGEYDRRAALLIIKFIETCKGLQFERVKEDVTNAALNLTASAKPDESSKIDIVSISSPSKVATDEAFTTTAKIQYMTPANSTIAIVAVDTDTTSIVSASVRSTSGHGEAELTSTLLSGQGARFMHLSLIPLIRTVENWTVVPGGSRSMIVQITDSFSLIVIVGYPDVPIQLDDKIYLTGTSGNVSVQTTRGEHHISVPSLILLGNNSRAVFSQWNTTASSSYLDFTVYRDVPLLAIYRKQYYLNVTSQLDQALGTGWYDEDSIAELRVAPLLVLRGQTYVFAGWIGDSNDSTPVSGVFMNSSKKIEASWTEAKTEKEDTGTLQIQALFVAALAVLAGSAVFVWISFRKKRPRLMTERDRSIV